MIFDIQRNSFVDGPGIRTTVFFKGCNLRCKWCHNPESQSGKREMLYYESKCTHCGTCVRRCPHEQHVCELCGRCTLFCPTDARQICGKEYTVDALLQGILKDCSYYEASGGGVTFSGGECMLQIDFLCEILRKCKENGIQTAVDTAGAVPWEHFERVIPYTDIFLYDVKCFTDSLHINGVGQSNALILDNLRRLFRAFNGEIIVRIPVIGGFNDDLDEMKQIADFLKTIGCKQAELLPYHRLGEHKYAALGKEHTPYRTPTDEQMAKFRSLFDH